MKVNLKINEDNQKIVSYKSHAGDLNIELENGKFIELKVNEEINEESSLSMVADIDFYIFEDESIEIEEINSLEIISGELRLSKENIEIVSKQELESSLVDAYRESILENQDKLIKIAEIMGTNIKTKKKGSRKKGTRKSTKYAPAWTKEEYRLAFDIYKIHRNSPPKAWLEDHLERHDFQRTTDAMLMRLANFAHIDPNHDYSGLDRTGEATKEFFETNYEELNK